jgi:hypothetical protein
MGRRSAAGVRAGAAILAALAMAGCATGPTSTPGPIDTRLATCGGGDVFPVAALAAPPGAEAGAGPQFDALRDGLARMAADEPGMLPSSGWRLVLREPTRYLFMADVSEGGAADWRHVEVALENGSWRWTGGGGCNLRVVLGKELGPAEWALDPAFAAPDAATTTLHVLVWERACASGQDATGRVAAPAIEYGADAVVVTFGVRPREGGQECPSNPPTPVVVELVEPLGSRALLDGVTIPPRKPEPPFGR